MDSTSARYLALLVAPLAIVFATLSLLGHMSASTALAGGLLSFGGVVWAVRHIKAELDEEKESQSLFDGSMQREFVRQARLAENYEVILDAIPEPVIVLRNDRRILHANRAVIDLLGHDPIDSDLTTAIRHPNVLNAAEGVLSGEQEAVTVEFARGGEVEQHLIARLVRLPGGRQNGPMVVVALHDLTAIRKTMEMRADFVANVSHELRTPLSTLVGTIETLRGPAKGDDEALEKFLSLMDEQGVRMTRLVEDLLSLSQIQANEHTRPTETVLVQEIVPTVARMLEPDAQKKSLNIVVDVGGDLPPIIGDSDQILQVFQNLIHNAVKYSADGKVVQVVAREEDGNILAISVADQGEGIPAEHIPRLTERFYRVDKARSRALGGTGLGLAIVKHILNRHQGRLHIDSEVGVGSTFTVNLPISRSEDALADRVD
ncbi:MAG: ATP-binding protein [Rhodospirillales bacterium]|nr:ATP-binding protein [Rhodospirillales bacterium]